MKFNNIITFVLDSVDLLELLHAEVLNLLQQLQVYDCSVVHGTTR